MPNTALKLGEYFRSRPMQGVVFFFFPISRFYYSLLLLDVDYVLFCDVIPSTKLERVQFVENRKD